MRVIIDTDIGTDVDDAWAISFALSDPELEVAGLTLVHGLLDIRAKIAHKMLRLSENTEKIPIILGESYPLTNGFNIYWNGREDQWALDVYDKDVACPKILAADFIAEQILVYPDTVICAIGPLTNIASAIIKYPDVMKKLKRLYVMGASFEGFNNPVREHNVRLDPDATRLVFTSGIPMTVIGLNATKQVTVNRSELYKLYGAPVTARDVELYELYKTSYKEFLQEMTEDYMTYNYGDYTYMHDPLTVVAMTDPSVTPYIKNISAKVDERGWVSYLKKPGSIDVADGAVDIKKFNQHLTRTMEFSF